MTPLLMLLIGLYSPLPAAPIVSTKSEVAACISSGGQAARVRDWVAELRTSQDANIVQFRQAHGLSTLADSAITVVADSASCAAAVQAYDAERRTRYPNYLAKPLTERDIYVVRMGASEHVVLDRDEALMAGEFFQLYWFADSFGRVVMVTTY